MTNRDHDEPEASGVALLDTDVETEPDQPAAGGGKKLARFQRTRADLIVDLAVAFLCVGVGTAWTFNLLRTQFTGGTFANYFDGQADAFLDGHLAIDKGVLGIEAFIRDGKEYMYFGPLLGLLRLPVTFVTDELDGRLTLISLFIATALFYWHANKLLDLVLALLHPNAEPSKTERWVRLAWRASVAAGTVVMTLLAIPWAYHEAQMWSAALLVAVMVQMLAVATQQTRRPWVFGLVLLALVLNRPTTAYAGLLGVAGLLVISWRRWPERRAATKGMFAWFLVALGSAVTVNWMKFRRPFGIPMEDQVFSSIDQNRAEMLARYSNKYFQTEFIPSNLWAYFRPDGVDLSSRFPYIDVPQKLPWVWGDAFYDATYRTASVTATNPLLLITSIFGLVVFVRMYRQPAFWSLLPLVAAGILATGGVAGWGYIATRYLTDFLPGMLVLTAIAVATFVRRLDARTTPVRSWLKRLGQVSAVVLIGWSITANVAIGFNYSFSIGDRTDQMARLLSLQDASYDVIGPSLADATVLVERLPFARYDPTPPGTLAIVGRCEALYYSNGDTVDTWVPVEYGESDWRREFIVAPGADLAVGSEIELVVLSESDVFDPEAYWFQVTMRVEEVNALTIEVALLMNDNFGFLKVLTKLPRFEPSELNITFDQSRERFFIERNGDNVLYGHFDMDPLYLTETPGVRFIELGEHDGWTFTERAVDTPWCDRLWNAAQA